MSYLINPNAWFEISRERRQQLLDEATQHRLVASLEQPSIWSVRRLLQRLNRVLGRYPTMSGKVEAPVLPVAS
jgi:hypothetical protein